MLLPFGIQTEMDAAIAKHGLNEVLGRAVCRIDRLVRMKPGALEFWMGFEFEKMDGQIPLQDDTEEFEENA